MAPFAHGVLDRCQLHSGNGQRGSGALTRSSTLARWRADNLTIPGAVDFHVLFCGIGKQQLGKLAWMGERNQVAAWDFVGNLTEAVAC